MFRISLVLVFTHPSLSQIFDKTADGIFNSIIGDVHVLKNIDPPKRYSELRAIEDELVSKNMKQVNNTHVKMSISETTSTTEMMPQVTPFPLVNNQNTTIDDLKLRMRKIHLNQLLERQTSPIPDFSKDEDDPALITRRFNKVSKQVKQQKIPNLQHQYFWSITTLSNNQEHVYWEKRRIISLMEHFIYETRYKLPYVQMLRNKFKSHYKYKIGYCFALLRHLKQQQKLMYNSLRNYITGFSNIMIHMKLYEKVVRLDVDLKDLIQLINRLNYLRKIDENPDYYVDSPEQPNKPRLGSPPNAKG